jgi:hypothetical protein
MSSRGRNEVILVALKRKHPYLSGNLIQEKYKEKDHGNHILQSQISHSANVDLCSFKIQYLELQKSN